jgi:hypothetical protein
MTKKNQHYMVQPQQTISHDDFARLMAATDNSQEAKPQESAGVLRTMGDVGIKLGQGFIGAGQGVIGLTNLATGGLTGRVLNAMGYNPEFTKNLMGEYLSDSQKQADQAVQQADGFGGTMAAALQNPRSILGAVSESAPMMLGGGAMVRALSTRIAAGAAAPLGGMATEAGAAAGKAAVEAAAKRLMLAGSATEGAMGAGQIAEQAQREGRAYSDYALPALGAGVMTAAIGYGSGRLFGDSATSVFSGAKSSGVAGSLPARVAKGVAVEGTEELLQSGQEQAMTNVAMGKPWQEGVGNAAAMGLVTGGVMGGGMATLQGRSSPGQQAADTIRATDTVPESGPMTRAANMATEQKARQAETSIDGAVPPAGLTPEQIEAEIARIEQEAARQEAMQLGASAQQQEQSAPPITGETNGAMDGVQSLDSGAVDIGIPDATAGMGAPSGADGIDGAAVEQPGGGAAQSGVQSASLQPTQPTGGMPDGAPPTPATLIATADTPIPPASQSAGSMAPPGVDPETGEVLQPAQQDPFDFTGKTDAELRAARQGAQVPAIRLAIAKELQARRAAQQAPKVATPESPPVVSTTAPGGREHYGISHTPFSNGGFALADKTEAQLAAEAKASRRLGASRTGQAGAPQAAHEFIAARGGLSRDVAQDLGIEGNKRIGNRWLYAAPGKGMRLDQAAEALREAGYTKSEDHNEALDVLRRSASGSPQHTAEGWDAIAKAETEARYSDYLESQQEAAQPGDFDPFASLEDDGYTQDDFEVSGYPDADEALQAEVRAMSDQLEALGGDAYDTLYDLTRNNAEATQDEYNQMAKQLLVAEIARTQKATDDENTRLAAEAYAKAAQPTGRGDTGENDGQPGAARSGAGQGETGQGQAKPLNAQPVRKFERRGDYWNYSGPDAKKMADALDAVVFQRNGTPTVGIPHHSLSSAKKTLKDAGFAATFDGADTQKAAATDEGLTSKFAAYNELAGQYGYEVSDDGMVGLKGKPAKVKMVIKGARLRMEGDDGTLLSSHPAKPESLGKFLESFWYAKKKDLATDKGLTTYTPEELRQRQDQQAQAEQQRKQQEQGAERKAKADAEAARVSKAQGNQPGFTITDAMRDNASGGLPLFSKGQQAQGMTAQAAQAVVTGITQKWANSPRVVVVESMESALVPEEVRQHDANQRSQGATGEPEGFWHGGKVYMVASALNGQKDIARVLFHEALGHHGLRGTFGDSLKPILQQLAALRRPLVEAKAREYGLDMSKERDRLQAAEEVLAEMAQTTPNIGFVRRAIAAIRAWLRDNVPGFSRLNLSDAEIIQQYILPARAWVQGNSSGMVAGEPVFQRGTTEVMQKSGRISYTPEANKQRAEAFAFKVAALNPAFEPVVEVDRGGSVYVTVRKHIMTAKGERAKNRNAQKIAFKARFADHGSYWGASISIDPITGNSVDDAVALFQFAENPKTPPSIREFKKSIIDPRDRAQYRETVRFNENVWKNGGRTFWSSSGREEVVAAESRLGYAPPGISDGTNGTDVGGGADGSTPSGMLSTLESKLGATVAGVSYDKNFGTGLSFTLGFPDSTVQMSVRDDADGVYVINIYAKEPGNLTKGVRGTGRGKQIMEALRSHADATSKPLHVVGVTKGGDSFWSKLDWLKRSDVSLDMGGQIAKSNWTYSYMPKATGKLPDTIEVDGVQRPTLNSNGKPIHPTQEGVRNFWRWFGDSKVVDADGRPLVVFHGTAKDFDAFDNSKTGANDGGLWGKGHYFALSTESANSYALRQGDGAKVIPAYVAIKQPLVLRTGGDLVTRLPDGTNARDLIGPNLNGWKIKAAALDAGSDGVIQIKRNGSIGDVVAYTPGQIKSTTGNNGAFSPENEDIRFSRSVGGADLAGKVRDRLNDTFNHPGKLNWWHRTVGSQYNLAERNPAFKPVFDAAQDFINDVAYYGTQAADRAMKILPKLETLADLKKQPISAADNKAVAAPIFEGTLSWARDVDGKAVRVDDLEARYSGLTDEQKAWMLMRKGVVTEAQLKRWQASPLDIYSGAVRNRFEATFLKSGVVWTDAELKSIFGLNDSQIALYKEFRAATNESLDNMAKAQMLREAGKDAKDLRDIVMEAPDLDSAATMLHGALRDMATENPDRADQLNDAAASALTTAAKIGELKKQGYAPLSRFGQYTVDVVVDGKREYFGLFETAADSNRMAAKMRMEFGASNVTQGTMSQKEFELFQGITPESLELFGNMLGLNSTGNEAQDKAFQDYLRLTKNNRSAMKRLIHRKGIAGYSEDVGRVLASFVYSNARQTSAAMHIGALDEAIAAIPRGEGKLKDHALDLAKYIKEPREEAAALRGMLFAQYLGGSVASAMVNFTQPLTTSIPYLSQFGGLTKAGAAWAQAIRDMAGKKTLEPDLAKAVQQAKDRGVISPQEVHQLMAQARGAATLQTGDGTRAGTARAMAGNSVTRVMLAWGKLFGYAEQVNRESTFIAAFRLAKAQGMTNPAEFATKAVNETQFVNNKANKMRFGRGAIGATLMTFKSYSINWLELMHRLATQEGAEGKRAAAYMLAALFLTAGTGGLPFADDLNDLIDSILQKMGYNVSAKKAKQEFLENAFGKAGAQFIDRGITGIPGVPIDLSGRMGMGNLLPGTGLMLTKADHSRDMLELAGPVGDMTKRFFEAAGQLARGEVVTALRTAAPRAVENAVKGADMADMGMYRDTRGAKVIDTTPGEAVAKMIGFQPASVSQVQEANGLNVRAKDFYTQSKQDISAKWAMGVFEGDAGKVQQAREMVADWNARNPEQPMRVNMADIAKRVRNMRKDKAQRIADTAPKAMREAMRRDLIGGQ